MEELPIGQLPAREAAPKVCETPGLTTARRHTERYPTKTRGDRIRKPDRRMVDGADLPSVTRGHGARHRTACAACCMGRNDRTTGVVGKRETHERKTARESFTITGRRFASRRACTEPDFRSLQSVTPPALVLQTDDGLDPKQRLRVDLTMTEIQCQPMSIRKRLTQEIQALGDIVQSVASRPISRAYPVGCGDSLCVLIGRQPAFVKQVCHQTDVEHSRRGGRCPSAFKMSAISWRDLPPLPSSTTRWQQPSQEDSCSRRRTGVRIRSLLTCKPWQRMPISNCSLVPCCVATIA